MPTSFTDRDYKIDLLNRISAQQVGSCTCMTKTHIPSHHSKECLYRVLDEAWFFVHARLDDN